MSYSVLIPCRNEEAIIADCIDAVLNQTVAASKILIVDDGSKDATPAILDEYKRRNDRISVIRLNHKQHKNLGYHQSIAVRAGLDHLIKRGEDFILKLDADAYLEDEGYVEHLIMLMSGDNRLGITGGHSDKGRHRNRHVSDGAKLYRVACLKEVLEICPDGRYPIMYGTDSFVLFRAQWLGWRGAPANIEYVDIRPYRRDLRRWVLTGKFVWTNGFTFLHELFSFIRYLRHKPLIIGSMIYFLSYLLGPLISRKEYEPSYYRFMKDYLDKITRYGFARALERTFPT